MYVLGVFLCTDKDRNVILGSCEEYLRSSDAEDKEDPRILGLSMIPGHQIVTVHIDENNDIDHRILWYCYQSCLHYFWVYSGMLKLIW